MIISFSTIGQFALVVRVADTYPGFIPRTGINSGSLMPWIFLKLSAGIAVYVKDPSKYAKLYFSAKFADVVACDIWKIVVHMRNFQSMSNSTIDSYSMLHQVTHSAGLIF